MIVMEMYYQNFLDTSGECSTRGETAENGFVSVAKRKKLKYRKATIQEQYKHIDWFLTIDGKDISFDVKGMKKSSRKDFKVRNDIVWIEYKNVSGDNGWLMGKANIIAFERENDYVLVPRKELLEFCDKNIEKTIVRESSQALYKLYTRSGRKDVISMIYMDDVLHKMNSAVWKK
jgi:penicillin-binding protein-related factor A (putative recombinase)